MPEIVTNLQDLPDISVLPDHQYQTKRRFRLVAAERIYVQLIVEILILERERFFLMG